MIDHSAPHAFQQRSISQSNLEKKIKIFVSSNNRRNTNSKKTNTIGFQWNSCHLLAKPNFWNPSISRVPVDIGQHEPLTSRIPNKGESPRTKSKLGRIIPETPQSHLQAVSLVPLQHSDHENDFREGRVQLPISQSFQAINTSWNGYWQGHARAGFREWIAIRHHGNCICQSKAKPIPNKMPSSARSWKLVLLVRESQLDHPTVDFSKHLILLGGTGSQKRVMLKKAFTNVGIH